MNAQSRGTGERIGKRWGFLILVAAVQTTMMIGSTVVMVSLPALREYFGVSVAELQWTITAYNLGFGGLLLVGGRLADIIGKRRILIIGVAMLLVASLFAGSATNEWLLVCMRGIQGIGAAMASPAALSLLTTMFVAPRERGIALGVWAACGATGAALGNVVGGIVTALVGWRWVFLLNVPLCIVLLALIPFVIPHKAPGVEAEAPRERRSLKLGSGALITAALVCLIMALSQLPQLGIASPTVISTLALAVVLGGVFVWMQVKSADPMINPGVFRGGSSVGFVMIALAASVGVGPYYVASIYMQEVLGYNAMSAGILFLPWCVMIALGAQFSARLVLRFGARRTLVSGFAVSVVGVLGFGLMASDSMSSVTLLVAFFVIGLGGGIVGVCATTVALAGVPLEFSGVGSGVANGSQQVGGALSIALVALIVTVNANASGSPDAIAVRYGLFCAAGLAALGLILAAFFAPGPLVRQRRVLAPN